MFKNKIMEIDSKIWLVVTVSLHLREVEVKIIKEGSNIRNRRKLKLFRKDRDKFRK